jgi:hypothetical protein
LSGHNFFFFSFSLGILIGNMNKPPSVPGFLTKTYEIFNTPEYQDICSWGPNGDTINIKKIEQFSKQILPKYFKHSNFQSFVRQLNMYDFHKTVQDPSHGEFQHQYFLKDRPELLIYIKRKANNRTAETLKKLSKNNSIVGNPGHMPNSSHNFNEEQQRRVHEGDDEDGQESITNLLPDELLMETDTVLTELEQQKLMHNEFERKMEAKMSQLEQENEVLKRLFMESNQKTMIMQERMEKVLKTIYSVFAANPQMGKALLSRIPSLAIEGTTYSSPKAMITDGSVPPLSSATAPAPTMGAESAVYGRDLELRRMPTYDPYGMLSSSMFGHNPLAGAELNAVDRGTSFDFAAASVAAPQKYLSTFDRAIFGGQSAGENGTNNSKVGVESDRVTLLSDDSPQKSPLGRGQKRTSDESLSAQGEESRTLKVPRVELTEPLVTTPGSSTPADGMLGPPLAPGELSHIEPQTREFIDLLNRNQNTTLCRLDSLEQTLATLLEDIDDDGFLNAAVPSGNDPAVIPSNGNNGKL